MFEGLRGKLVDRPAGGIRARKGDLLHQRVLDKRSTYFLAEAGDHVHHTGRESRLLDQLDEFQRRGGSEFGRLQHRGAAGGERRGELPRGQQQRRVPRGDHCDDAQRLVPGEVEVALLVQRDDRTLDLVGQSAEVVVPLRDVIELALHLGEQLPVVAHFDRGQFLCIARDQVAQPVQQQSALTRSELRPWALGKGAVRGAHRAVHVGGVSLRDLRPGFTRVRVVTLEPLPGRGLVVPTIDIQRVALHAVSFTGSPLT